MKDVRPQARPSKNRDIPHPGRRWYDGQWRTPEQVARRQEQHREKMRKRRQSSEYVRAENKQARDRMRVARRSFFRPATRWKPKPEELRAAACSDELMALVEDMIRDDGRYILGTARGLGPTHSLDAPMFSEGNVGSWHEIHGDPNHWREPGAEAGRLGS